MRIAAKKLIHKTSSIHKQRLMPFVVEVASSLLMHFSLTFSNIFFWFNIGIKTCTYKKQGFIGNSNDYLLSQDLQPPRPQVSFKSCRRRCYEREGCNYWSYVTNKNDNITERKTCYLYSDIDGEPTYDFGKISGVGPHICFLSLNVP